MEIIIYDLILWKFAFLRKNLIQMASVLNCTYIKNSNLCIVQSEMVHCLNVHGTLCVHQGWTKHFKHRCSMNQKIYYYYYKIVIIYHLLPVTTPTHNYLVSFKQ